MAYFLIGLGLGLAIGIVAMVLILRGKTSGKIVVDSTDVDGTYLFLEVKNMEDILNHREVTLEVVRKSYASQN